MNEPIDLRAWITPPRTGVFDDLDLALLDPADEADRAVLIAAEHPQQHAAIEAGLDEVEIDGQLMSPRLHLTLHEVLANRIWEDDADTVRTVRRLIAQGHDRHDVMHMIVSVIGEEIWHAMHHEPFDAEETRRRLDALPAGWYDDVDEAPLNRAERRAQARQRRR